MSDRTTAKGPDLEGLPADPTTAPFWRAARERRLVVQRCASCGACQFYPRPFCLACSGLELEWVAGQRERDGVFQDHRADPV